MLRFSCLGAVCTAALALGLAGCQGGTMPDVEPVSEVVPFRGEYIIVDQIEIVVDASGSMDCQGKFPHAAALARSFVQGMPQGEYLAGLTAFGQEGEADWVRVPLAPFDRGALQPAADSLAPIRGRTPLHRALNALEPGLAGKGGRGVVLVFSDGLAKPGPVLDACKRLADAQVGELCIYTVQIGNEPEGFVLLSRMADQAECGRRVSSGAIRSAEGMRAFIREIFFGGTPTPDTALAPELPPVYFDTDKSVIKPEYQAVIQQATDLLAANPALRLLIDGHADARHTDGYNLGLGNRRATAVRDALVGRGIDPARLRIYSWGESKPAASNDTAPGKAQNRRVDLIVLPE